MARGNVGRIDLYHVAGIFWEAYEGLVNASGDLPVPPWLAVDNEKRAQVVAGVKFHAENPNATAADSHEHWRKYMEARGYQYGDEKNVKEKTHPAMIPFNQLPPDLQLRHKLFTGMCKVLIPYARREAKGLR